MRWRATFPRSRTNTKRRQHEQHGRNVDPDCLPSARDLFVDARSITERACILVKRVSRAAHSGGPLPVTNTTPAHRRRVASRGLWVAKGVQTLVSTPTNTNPSHKPPPKASYEANEDVQRWLKEQTLDAGGATKPRWNPTFLAAQRDAPWILSALERFYEEDLITDILSVVKSGKEATVYCCAAHPSLGVERVAAKVYRPRMFRSLKNDAVYRMSRIQRDADGREARGERYLKAARKSAKGRAAQVAWWIDYEYETQRTLYDAGADVPRPVAHIGNSILMEFIGGDEGAAPTLREVELEREEAQSLFDRLLRNVELALAHDRIHGDLSAYNVLYWQGGVTIIDFAQAVDPRYNLDVFAFLARDIERVCHYFARYGIAADAGAIAHDIWRRYLSGDL